MNLERAIALYIGELARRGRGGTTRARYQRALQGLHALTDSHELADFSVDDVRAYLDRWVGAAPATLAFHVSLLKGFFGFLHEEGLIDHDPTLRLSRPPQKRAEELDVVTVSPEDVKRLIAAAREWDEKLCLAALCYLGPRRSALGALRRRDVDLERGTIRFHEKGGKIIVKPLPDALSALLREAEAAGVWSTPYDYLIPSRARTRARERSSRVIYDLVKRVGERIDLEVYPHALRAAFAVQFDEQHPDQLIALKELMGHSDIDTTLVYLRRKDKAKAMEQVRDLSWSA